MNLKNIRSYAIGRFNNGREITAEKVEYYWWIKEGVISAVVDANGFARLFDTLPEAIEAGKAYLSSNGGEVYSDGDGNES